MEEDKNHINIDKEHEKYIPVEKNEEIEFVQEKVNLITTELKKIIVGQENMLDLLIVGMLSHGHILVEGVPGIAKTLTVRLLSKVLDVDFKRIQFTPDLMPSDVIGTNVFNVKTSEFNFREGPIFSNFILIDEINRAPAKTQAALFEVMEEKQITVDGKTYSMGFPFFIVATQNPIEQEGTYKLPEAQLDRFLFKIKLSFPELDNEKKILYQFNARGENSLFKEINQHLTKDDLRKCFQIIGSVQIKNELLDYIATIVHDTRENPDLFLGASPRASLAIMNTSKAIAAMSGRDFVIPEDIQKVSAPVLNHRIILSPEKEMEGLEPEDVIDKIVHNIEVPR